MANELPWLEPRYSTCRDHALDAIRAFDEICDEPEAADARAWMQEHLPPAAPSTFLHGDLLGQNILLGLGESDAPAQQLQFLRNLLRRASTGAS